MAQTDNIQPLSIEPSAFQPLDTATAPPPQRGKPIRWVLVACATVFVLVMAFLLSARSLQITVVAEKPAEEEVHRLLDPYRHVPPPQTLTGGPT